MVIDRMVIAYRILLLTIIRTSYSPDEYFQVLEPSFNLIMEKSIRYFLHTEIIWKKSLFVNYISLFQNLGMGSKLSN